MNDSELSSRLLNEIISWGESELTYHHIENPRRDILWMAGDMFDCQLSDIHLNKKTVSKHQLTTFRKWIRRRINHEPVQKITGKTEFYGLPIYLEPNVFIPRPETERLVDVVLRLTSDQDSVSILDIGTGSGCVAVALANQKPKSNITAIDISPKALITARKNVSYHGLDNIQFQKMDILKETPKHRYNIVVSNPPYIPKTEMKCLMPEVFDHDPVAALTDDADGLTFYRYFAEHFQKLVRPNGNMVLETGNGGHPYKALKIFRKYGMNAELKKDYSGIHRVLIAHIK